MAPGEMRRSVAPSKPTRYTLRAPFGSPAEYRMVEPPGLHSPSESPPSLLRMWFNFWAFLPSTSTTYMSVYPPGSTPTKRRLPSGDQTGPQASPGRERITVRDDPSTAVIAICKRDAFGCPAHTMYASDRPSGDHA